MHPTSPEISSQFVHIFLSIGGSNKVSYSKQIARHHSWSTVHVKISLTSSLITVKIWLLFLVLCARM